MSLVYQQNINAGTKLGVWHIEEPEFFFLEKVIIQKEISHPLKRLQHLAGRYLLTELFNDFPLDLIMIADTRKPYLENDVFHFSISHCGDYAAAIASREKRVGIDIEIPKVKVETVKHKFLVSEEMQLLSDLPMGKLHQLTLGWSIKEAIFKWLGSGEMDFRLHMNIRKVTKMGEQFISECSVRKSDHIQLVATSIFIEDIFLTWVITDA